MEKGFVIECEEENFQDCEMMLFEMAFKEKPWFEWVKVRTNNICATYRVEKVGYKWYIVT